MNYFKNLPLGTMHDHLSLADTLAAHFVPDLPDALSASRRELPSMWNILDHARSRTVALIGDSVFPNRFREHADASVLPALQLLPAEKTLAIISHRAMSSVGDASALSAAQKIVESLRLQGRIDGPEILQSALAIENALRADLYRLTGDQDYGNEIASVRLPAGDALPLRQVVCCDMDGVLALLKPINGASGVVGFRDTVLGRAVQENAERFEAQLLGWNGAGNADANARDTEMGLLPYLVQTYGVQMQEHWFEEAQDRIRQIYTEAYPLEYRHRALSDADAHIAAMPGAYHVFRHKTWDHDLATIYDTDSSPRKFTEEVRERGGQLVFITAAPKIHAVKMLAFSGIMEALGPDGFTLYSVEDMYREGSVNSSTFIEGDKGEILRRLRRKTGLSADKFVMAGDQVHSDVLPATAVGVDACLVSGPQELAKYARLIRLPNDSASV